MKGEVVHSGNEFPIGEKLRLSGKKMKLRVLVEEERRGRS